MGVEVDSVIVDLEARIGQYRTDMREAIGLQKQYQDGWKSALANNNAAQQAATEAKKAAKETVQAEEQATASIKRTRKVRTDDEIAAAERSKIAERERVAAIKQSVRDEAAAVKAAEKEKQAAISETKTLQERANARPGNPNRVIGDLGVTNTVTQAEYEAGLARQRAAIAAVPNSGGPVSRTGTGQATSEKEINQVLIQRAELQERLKVANAEDAAEIRAQLTELKLAVTYEQAGLDAKEATARLDRELLVIETQRAARASERAAADAAANKIIQDRLALQGAILGADKDDAVAIKDQLFALNQMARYRAAGLTEAEAQVRVDAELLGIEEKRVRAAAEQAAIVEKQMRAQTEAIAGKISGAGVLTAGLVGGLGVAEISHLNDRYIELSNSLKVAGVSASELDEVQQHLLATANKNGTNINALADVFRSASLGAHDLGASQADLLKLTDAASNSLRIQGVSASKAQGSLLQLGHAFESGRVNAREFNSLALNLYPILQAAAKGSDQFGGSVGKLRSEIIAGNVSSKVFFDAIIKGSDDLEQRAAKSTLTTAQGFTSLTNALVVYFGEADKAQGISAALGEALRTLGENLDTLIPAIAAIGAALTTGYIVRMTQAAIATKGLGASILGAFGGPVGLAITAVGLAIAGTVVEVNDAHQSAVSAAEGLKALQDQYGKAGTAAKIAGSGATGLASDMFGSIPKINSFAGAVGNAAQQLYNQARAARAAQAETLKAQLTSVQQKVQDVQGRLPEGVNSGISKQLNNGHIDIIGDAKAVFGGLFNRAGNIFSGGRADDENRKALKDLNGQQAIIQKQLDALDPNKHPITAGDVPSSGPDPIDPKTAKALANLNSKLAGLELLAKTATGARLDKINKQIDSTKQKITDINAGASPAAANAVDGVGGGRRGKSAETLANEATERDKRYSDELAQIHDRYLSNEKKQADGSDAEYALQETRILAAQDKRKADYLAQEKLKQIDAGRAKELIAQDVIATNSELKAVELQKQVTAYNKQTDAIDRQNQLQDELAQVNESMLTTSKERQAAAVADIERQRQRDKDAAIRTILSPDPNVTDAQRIAAGAVLNPDQDKLTAAQIAAAKQKDISPGQEYAKSLETNSDTIQSSEVDVLKSVNSELDKSVEKYLHIHGILGDIIGDLVDMAIKQALIKPLANSLFGGDSSGSSGGGLGGLLGGLGKLVGLGGSSIGSSGLASIAGGTGDVDSLVGLGGFATGGSGVLGGKPGVDQNILSLNGTPIRKVGRGELLTVTPNGAVNPNQRVSSGGPQYTVIAPQHFDLSNVVMTPDLVSQMDKRNRAYADQVGRAAFAGAVSTSGRQAPGFVSKAQTLKG